MAITGTAALIERIRRRFGDGATPSSFHTQVVSSRQLTPTTHAIELAKPETFTFLPTQFTFLQLLTEWGAEARPMSLSTSPTRPNLEYAVRISDSAYKRAFAALRPGDEVGIIGALGDFVLQTTRPAILVAGGIGITPLKGMAEYASDHDLTIPVRLVYSNRSEDEIAYRDELAALESQNAHFHVLHALTGDAGTSWRGATGRIDQHLIRAAARDLVEPVYYVSGTPSMVISTWRLLLQMGVPEHAIAVEAFRGYP